MVMKNSVLWDIPPCSPLKVNRRSGGTCRFRLHGSRVNQARKQREAKFCLHFNPEDGCNILFRSISRHFTNCTALYPRRDLLLLVMVLWDQILFPFYFEIYHLRTPVIYSLWRPEVTKKINNKLYFQCKVQRIPAIFIKQGSHSIMDI
jgi:hypothetical protein